MRYKLVACAVACLSLAAPANARHVQTSKVRHVTEEGKSKWYTVDVTYLTGNEIIQATKSLRYQGLKSYAVIFWDKDQASVIQLSTLLVCGIEFTASCMPIMGNLKGVDQENREWEICTGSFCA